MPLRCCSASPTRKSKKLLEVHDQEPHILKEIRLLQDRLLECSLEEEARGRVFRILELRGSRDSQGKQLSWGDVTVVLVFRLLFTMGLVHDIILRIQAVQDPTDFHLLSGLRHELENILRR